MIVLHHMWLDGRLSSRIGKIGIRNVCQTSDPYNSARLLVKIRRAN